MANKLTINNFILRLISALCLIPTVLLCIIIGDLPYLAMVILISILMAFEWQKISYQKNAIKWQIMGLCYILSIALSLIWLRANPFFGTYGTIWLMVVVWSSDTFAFIVGSLIGGKKILPKISPNKTWSGFIGAILGGTFISYLLFKYFNESFSTKYLIISITTTILAQSGDFLESFFKRVNQAKNSGSIIPGHGGVLDRVDSMFLSSIFLLIIVISGYWY